MPGLYPRRDKHKSRSDATPMHCRMNRELPGFVIDVTGLVGAQQACETQVMWCDVANLELDWIRSHSSTNR